MLWGWRKKLTLRRFSSCNLSSSNRFLAISASTPNFEKTKIRGKGDKKERNSYTLKRKQFFQKLTSLKKDLKAASSQNSPIFETKMGIMNNHKENEIREKVGNHISFYFNIISKMLCRRHTHETKRGLEELMSNCKSWMGEYPFVLQVIEATINKIQVIFLMDPIEKRVHLMALASHLEIWSMKLWYNRDTNKTEEYRNIEEMTKIINPDMPVLWEIVKDLTFLLIVLEIGK